MDFNDLINWVHNNEILSTSLKSYTYIIINHRDCVAYIGCRTSKKTTPHFDLGVVYFSSSSNKLFIKEQQQHPEVFTHHILSAWESHAEALNHENQLHEMFNVHKNPLFLNRARNSNDGLKFCHVGHTSILNVETNIRTYIPQDQPIPDGFIKHGPKLGKVALIDPSTKEIKFFDRDLPHPDWGIFSPSKGTVSIKCTKSGVFKRHPQDLPIPDGWTKESHNKNKQFIFDLLSRKVCVVDHIDSTRQVSFSANQTVYCIGTRRFLRKHLQLTVRQLTKLLKDGMTPTGETVSKEPLDTELHYNLLLNELMGTPDVFVADWAEDLRTQTRKIAKQQEHQKKLENGSLGLYAIYNSQDELVVSLTCSLNSWCKEHGYPPRLFLESARTHQRIDFKQKSKYGELMGWLAVRLN